MNNSNTPNQRIAKMTFASVYPLYLAKVEKKGRTKEELNQIIAWLTGFNNEKLKDLIETKATFENVNDRIIYSNLTDTTFETPASCIVTP